jgi:hypothetical protein
MCSIVQQVEAFASGTRSEYAFPAGLSVEERKLVKMTAEKLGLSSQSFGMGGERQIHIFKPTSSMTPILEPVKYSVKNTFVDGPLDTAMEQELVTPAHKSMPVGSLQEHIAAEEESFAATPVVKVHASPRTSEVDTSSTKDSDSEPMDAPISIKNTFVHFETDSKEHVEPRIIQSMPAGTFAENIEAERAVAANEGGQILVCDKWGLKSKPLPLSEDSDAETDGPSAMLFPSTPNAENQMNFGIEHAETVPVVQWIPPTTVVPESSITVLPPAFWAPQSPAQTLLENESSPAQGQPQGPPQGPPQGTVPPIPPPASPPAYFMPGTPVVLQGLTNQPDFNGLHGVVSAFDADCGRYNVMVEIGPNALKRLVKIKFQNLIPAPQWSMPHPPCSPPVHQSVGMSRPAKASLVLDQMV